MALLLEQPYSFCIIRRAAQDVAHLTRPCEQCPKAGIGLQDLNGRKWSRDSYSALSSRPSPFRQTSGGTAFSPRGARGGERQKPRPSGRDCPYRRLSLSCHVLTMDSSCPDSEMRHFVS